MLKRILIAGGVLLLILLIVGGVFGTRMYFMIQGFKNQKQVATVSEETAKQETWQPNFTAVGNLEPVQGADIANQVAGNVAAINFDSGQQVEKGQLLVQLDDSNEQAQLAGYKAQEKLADLNAQRAHDIFSKHLISQSDVDTADSNLKQAQANVANTQADIAKKSIRAPFSGYAGIRNVNLGQYLPQGTVLVTLQALDHMYAGFALPEQALPSLARGQRVEVTVDAYPTQKFSGQVNAIDSKVDPSSHTVRVQALISNPQHMLRAGMFANISVSAGKSLQLVTVPKSSVTYSLYGNSVFIVAPDKEKKDDKGQPLLTASEVFVKLGQEQGNRVAVLEGVKAGDMVVTSGMQKLHTGATVAINNDVTPDQNPGAAGK
ncbi:MAG TPA: efflux RND transporter periplasmic adaptor subunit [Gammaproteobacteria bacterium]|jgi:membrane fusion protein (multidrug efflux system)|nr:efflux RND transporter periplasmic adaptor subunit [Gammaproteobacteria bacterium]